MPEGAFQEELGNLLKFRNYVAAHAIGTSLSMDLAGTKLSDVRVVVGSDKATSWGWLRFPTPVRPNNPSFV